MDRTTRSRIQRATQAARRLLEDEYREQLEGTFDVRLEWGESPRKVPRLPTVVGAHLTPGEHVVRGHIVDVVGYKQASGLSLEEALAAYLREAAFTMLNRFVALFMLEARGLVQQCVSKGEESSGFKEFCALAPGLIALPDRGYRLYLETLCDEIAQEVRVLFDRRDRASLLWPRRQALLDLLGILGDSELAPVWGEDETIGWVYQYFNGEDERRKMREESQAPRNGRELAVRNQFFTPRYVVQFLVDNTLGRTWVEMHGEQSRLAEICAYRVRTEGSGTPRPRKDPRDLRLVDPACGSGHFLLYCFDLLLEIYEEAWMAGDGSARSERTGQTLREDFPGLESLRRHLPSLILEHNLYGVDVDPRAAQIAALALWLRAQRAWKEFGVPARERPPVRRTRIIVAEPMPGDEKMVADFAGQLRPSLLGDLFRILVDNMRLAGELGSLVSMKRDLVATIRRGKDAFYDMTGYLPGMAPDRGPGELDLSGTDEKFFLDAVPRLMEALESFASVVATSGKRIRQRMFVDDSLQGIALIELLRTRFDVVLMNPPFGAASLAAKKEFEQIFPRTKNDIYAAFVERGVQLLHPRGLLGAITSRTGFFLSSFQKWREEILLKEAPPVVFADLGHGVMDAAMVEAAAYCLEKGAK